jgi:hypothetical protein
MKQAENSSVSFRIEVTYYHSPALLLLTGVAVEKLIRVDRAKKTSR